MFNKYLKKLFSSKVFLLKITNYLKYAFFSNKKCRELSSFTENI